MTKDIGRLTGEVGKLLRRSTRNVQLGFCGVVLAATASAYGFGVLNSALDNDQTYNNEVYLDVSSSKKGLLYIGFGALGALLSGALIVTGNVQKLKAYSIGMDESISNARDHRNIIL